MSRREVTTRESRSPWNGEVVWQGRDDTQLAKVLARAATAWAGSRPTPVETRRHLERLAAVIVARRAEAVDLLIREAGKVRVDAESEVDLLGRKIALSLGPGLERTPLAADPKRLPRNWSEPAILWRPRGVALCLGPFNFPLHLLHGLVVPALAAGCPVIAKPSERTPALGCWYRGCLSEAGFGDEAQVIIGGATAARALARSPVVATVAAVGSRTMGEALSRLLAPRPEVVLALELGGINHALLCADADLSAAIPALADGAFRMAGQRCTATRIVHVPRKRLDEVVDRLVAVRRQWLPTRTPLAPLGPLIATGERERFQAAFRAPDPAWQVLDGPLSGDDAFAEPVLLRAFTNARESERYRTEHFGPHLIVDVYDDESEAVRLMRANPYRLSAAVWTADKDRFRALAPQLPYGLVNWNRNTAGARSDLPFGGLGLSGNGRPAAVAAGQIFADETVVA
jgi:succinylglutamic semialdehyde dehydrogenase